MRKGDGGPFTCIVVNAAGQDTLTYNLAVQGMIRNNKDIAGLVFINEKCH